VDRDRTRHREQVEKLISCRTLHGSESLCKLLHYLADHSLERSGTSPKEYQIATEVFGRPKDFDPHLDSTVRVQAGRLRAKLAEYYASEGAEDQILIDIPRGTYALAFHDRPQGGARNLAASPQESFREASRGGQNPRNWLVAAIILSVILSVAFTIATDRFLTHRTVAAGVEPESADMPTALRVFWRGFLTNPQEPWVIFSNAAFVGRPTSGMRYYNSARDRQTHTLDHYTGVGEVLAVHALDNVFGELHQQLRVKRGSLFSLDDAKNNDLIFVGSPSENLALLEIPGTKDFVFREISSGPRAGEVEIVNLHPESGEPKSYLATPSDDPLTEDYSVVALVKGLNPSRSELILAGTTTIGTQAAVEYVCQQDSLGELLLRLSVSTSGELKPFEAVIHVKVARGVPVGTELVALHKKQL